MVKIAFRRIIMNKDYIKLQIRFLDIGWITSLIIYSLAPFITFIKWISVIQWIKLVYDYKDNYDLSLMMLISPLTIIFTLCFLARLHKASSIGRFYSYFKVDKAVIKDAGLSIDLNETYKNFINSMMLLCGRDKERILLNEKEEVAHYIKQNREKVYMTQQHLADASSISLKTVQRVEKTGAISKENLRAICAVLNIKTPTLEESSDRTLLTLGYDALFSNAISYKTSFGISIVTFILYAILLYVSMDHDDTAYGIIKNEIDFLSETSTLVPIIIIFFALSLFPAYCSLPTLLSNLFAQAPKQKKSFILGMISSFVLTIPVLLVVLSINFFITNMENTKRNVYLLSLFHTYSHIESQLDQNNKDDMFIKNIVQIYIRTNILLQTPIKSFSESFGDVPNISTEKNIEKLIISYIDTEYKSMKDSNVSPDSPFMKQNSTYIDPVNRERLIVRIKRLQE